MFEAYYRIALGARVALTADVQLMRDVHVDRPTVEGVIAGTRLTLTL